MTNISRNQFQARQGAVKRYKNNSYTFNVSQAEQKAQYKMKKYEEQYLGYFSSSKYGNEYTMRLNHSLGRLKSNLRRNLYAMVMPAGHGKSSLSRRYGVIDVDDLVSSRVHEVLVADRYDIMRNNKPWVQHNEYWHEQVSKTLDLLDYSYPVVMLVHSEETALELGAEVLRTMVLTQEALERNIAKRSMMEKVLARLNRETVMHSRYEAAVVCNSFEEVEKEFLNVMNANGLPVAAPYKYSSEYKNVNYSDICPLWIQNGTLPDGKHIHDVVEYYRKGAVPKECVDYYVWLSEINASQGFGVTMNDWGRVMGEVADGIARKRTFDTDEVTDVNKIFPFGEPKEQSRANVTVRRLLKSFPGLWDHPDVLEIAQHHVGSRNVFVSNLILHWKSMMQGEEIARLMKPVYHVSEFHFTEVTKRLHALIRTSDFFFKIPVAEPARQKMMYMDLLIGRKSYTISRELAVGGRDDSDWVPDRVAYDPDLNQWTKEEYQKIFNQGLDASLVKIRTNPRVISPVSFIRFWEDNRRLWVTQGGLAYNKLKGDEKKYITLVMDEVDGSCKELIGRHKKGTLFEVRDLMAIIDERAENFNRTISMEKFETGGRERVLNPGSLTHYIFFSYILFWAEKQEQVGSVRLNAPNDDDIRYFDRNMGKLFHLLYDWASFNEGHSVWEMERVIAKLGEERLGQPTDFHLFVGAIAEAMYDMQMEVGKGDEKETVHIKKGLMSGWRGTTWINTTLNYVYKYIGHEVYRRIYKQNSLVFIDGGGDDVNEAFTDGADPLRVLFIMNRIGYDAKIIKQLLAEKSEFFRVTIDSTGCYASPTRGLAAFVAGDWETSGRFTIREKVTSILDQVSKLVRRGMDHDVANGMAAGALSHWTRINKDDGWLDLPKEVWHATAECGGLDIPDENGDLYVLDKPVRLIDKRDGKRIAPGNLASSDYVMELSRDLAKYGLEVSRMKDLVDKMANDQFEFNEESDRVGWLEVVTEKYTVVEKVRAVVHRDNAELFSILLEHKPDESLTKLMRTGAKFSELAGYLQQDGKAVSEQQLLTIISGGRLRKETIDFQGNPHYRRIVPDFWGVKIMSMCCEAINAGIWDQREAGEAFETMCSMASRAFNNYM